MTRILAIDPGSTQSAWLWFDTATWQPVDFGISPNDDVLRAMRLNIGRAADVVVIEQIRSYGMAVGAEVFDTVWWSGRFAEAAYPTPVHQLPRMAVKSHLCHSAKARDANIRQELLDRFGGKDAAIGTVKAPGPLRGISKDVWAALAVAITWADTEGKS